MVTYEEKVKEATKAFIQVGIEEAAFDAKELLLWVTGYTNLEYAMKKANYMESVEVEEYEKAVCRRQNREPLQYITNQQNFYGRDFFVDKRVLIPRFDTEILVETILSTVPSQSEIHILDVCTGSGCIAITLSKELEKAKVWGTDISKKALEVAEKNNLQLGANVVFYESDLYDKVEGQFDIIVSNPPYIKSHVVVEQLQPEVKDYEPRLALDGKEDGLWFYKKLVEEARNYIKPGGYLFFEIGYDEGIAVSEMLKQNGWYDIKVKKDYKELDRVVYARRH